MYIMFMRWTCHQHPHATRNVAIDSFDMLDFCLSTETSAVVGFDVCGTCSWQDAMSSMIVAYLKLLGSSDASLKGHPPLKNDMYIETASHTDCSTRVSQLAGTIGELGM